MSLWLKGTWCSDITRKISLSPIGQKPDDLSFPSSYSIFCLRKEKKTENEPVQSSTTRKPFCPEQFLPVSGSLWEAKAESAQRASTGKPRTASRRGVTVSPRPRVPWPSRHDSTLLPPARHGSPYDLCHTRRKAKTQLSWGKMRSKTNNNFSKQPGKHQDELFPSRRAFRKPLCHST